MSEIARLSSALSGRYAIERELGRGGMATVYLANDLKHSRRVALKVLRPDLAHTLGAERFLREIRFAANLSHPNILPLFDSGEADGVLFYVMPNVEGESLRDKLATSTKLPVDEAVRLTAEIADALDYAHKQGVLHRDIKPENIMLLQGHALIADFGIGKAVGEVEGEAFTQSGASVGTPAYMSPEQAAGEHVDGRSDIYSLGCMLYEMLAGEQPFTGPTVQAVIAKRFVQTPADITALREGVARHVARALQQSMARAPIDRFDTAGALATALRTVESRAAKQEVTAPEKSIAVLPFANMSADPENEFFADGVTEEILNSLAQIPDLRVAGRTSSFSFKGKNADVRSIGEQLSVRTVLEGSVRRAGKRVRITAQLIDVTDGYHLWSERYDRDVEDVFAVQDEIASSIAEKMKAALHSGGASVQRAPDNVEAYDAYLKGRVLLAKRGPTMKLGLQAMQRALELDPSYAIAWSGLADAYSLMVFYALAAPELVREQARHAARKAVELAPELAEAHASVALVNVLFDWDWAGAEVSFKRAMSLNPGYTQAQSWYAIFYLQGACADFDGCHAMLTDIARIDPLSSYNQAVFGLTAAFAGRPEQGLVASERAMQLDPEAFQSIWARQAALHGAGRYAEAVELGEQLAAVSGRNSTVLSWVAAGLVQLGDYDSARAVYSELQSRAHREFIPPIMRATLAAELGETAATGALLREGLARHDPTILIYAVSNTLSTKLRDAPEYVAFMDEAKMPGWNPGAPGWPAGRAAFT